MFTPQPIGFVSSPYKNTAEVPKGLGAKHEADGVIEILPELELGLTDIEGFSHLIVIWEFDRSHGIELLGTPPSENWVPFGVAHGTVALRCETASPQKSPQWRAWGDFSGRLRSGSV